MSFGGGGGGGARQIAPCVKISLQSNGDGRRMLSPRLALRTLKKHFTLAARAAFSHITEC